MKKRLMNNIGLKLLAFFAAILLWFIVVNIDDPVDTKTYTNIPVTVTNEEVVTASDKTYQTVDNTQEVNVTVRAKRSLLGKIKAEDIIATANMKELMLRSQIPIEIAIKGYEGKYESAYSTPGNLQVKIDDEKKATLPVTPTTTGTVRDGYELGEITANPEKIVFRGPKTMIDSISRVVAEADVSGLSSDATLDATLILYDANNKVIDQTLLTNNLGKDGVSVEVSLLHTKNVPINFDTSSISVAEGYKFKGISYEPKEVKVLGEESDLEDLTEIDVPASALISSDLTQRTDKTVDISSYLPEDVTLAEKNANTIVVTISVEKPGTKTFEVATSSITVNNLADNLELNYDTAVDLEIQIEGPSDALEVFSVAKKASIDLKEYTKAGTYTVPVTIELPEGCTLVNDVVVEVVLEDSIKGNKDETKG